jgi:predicted Zn finger-like uncharacterized protein
MHFMCESCKASLSIADEKVKGKRLVVRCKRCGARIQIADPALGMAAILLGPEGGPAGAARAAPRAAPLSARPPLGSAPRPGAGPGLAARTAPRVAPSSAPAPRSFDPRRQASIDAFGEVDTESTRAMDTEVLEKALRASKSTEGTASSFRQASPRPAAASARAGFAAPPPARVVPRPASWFAMIAGKQIGPLSAGELDGQIASGALGPRSYVWTEGMAAWARAREVPDLAAFFGPEPQAQRAPAPRQRSPSSAPLRQTPAPSAARTTRAGSPAGTGVEPRSSPFDFGRTAPLGEELPGEEARAALSRPAQDDDSQPGLELDAYDPAAELDGFEPAQALEALDSVEEPGARDPAAALEGLAASSSPGAREKAAPTAKSDAVGPAREDLGDLSLLELDQPAEQTPEGDAAPEPDALAAAQELPLSPDQPAAAAAPGLAALSWAKDHARPLLLAASGVVLGLLLLLLALSGRTKAPQKPTPATAQQGQGRAAAPNGATPGGEPNAATRVVETPVVRSPDSPAIRSDAPGRDPGGAPLTAEDVKKKLDQNKSSLQRCIDEALRRDPRDPALRAGRIRITTTIAPSGLVIGAKIDKRGVDETPLGACLKSATRRIVFPAFPGEPFDVDIPIVVTASN